MKLLPLTLSVLFTITVEASSLKARMDLESFLFGSQPVGVKTEAFILKTPKTAFAKFEIGDASTKHLLWSMTKSVSSLIYGALEEKGVVSRQDSIYKYLQREIDAIGGKRAERLKEIKLVHLLTMSSGLDWSEKYEDDPFNSDIVRLLYLELSDRGVGYVLDRDLRSEPGKSFYYSSGDTYLLMAVLKNAVAKEKEASFPWDELFTPAGLDAIFERDKSGVFVGSSYLYLTTQDLVKVAELILGQGQLEGKRIISESYMRDFATVADVNQSSCSDEGYTYGLSVWLNHPCPVTQKKRYPNAPDNIIMLLGHAGQSLVIFPDHGTYAIRIAQDQMNAFDFTKYLGLIQGVLDAN